MTRHKLDQYTNASLTSSTLTKQISTVMRILRSTDVAITPLTDEELSYLKAIKHQCYKTLARNKKDTPSL